MDPADLRKKNLIPPFENGHDVVCFDAVPPPPFSVIYPALDRVRCEFGSILDLARLQNIVREHDVDAIVHLAPLLRNAGTPAPSRRAGGRASPDRR